MDFTPTREAALGHLQDFLPHAAKYASTRNYEQGDVSKLSPYIRTRLLTEEEITRAVLNEHGPGGAEKFLQEIAWRTYWKGWLEMRPSVWTHYLESLAESEMTTSYDNAISAKTGIECFDHWSRELFQTDYLHNHARMWFASIWIFTLKLPWQLGADFFMSHLLDADPASNTLSWRWVAGLHTPGKHYLARAENIRKYTGGRFNPVGELDEHAPPLSQDRNFEIRPLGIPKNPSPTGRIGHLMFPDDLSPSPLDLGRINATAAYVPQDLETSPLVTNFLNGAVNDAMSRAHGTRLRDTFLTALNDWIVAEKLETVIVAYPTVGPTRDFLAGLILPARLQFFVRDWDRSLWPHATAGFFKFRKHLPEFHRQIC